MTQGTFGVTVVEGQARFAETLARGHVAQVLEIARHPERGPVRFDLDGQRFSTQGMRGVLLGASGSGKSYTLAVLAEEVHRIGVPFLVFDQESEYLSLGELRGVRVFTVQDELKFDYHHLAAFVLYHGGAAVLDVGDLRLDAQREAFVRLARELFLMAKTQRRRAFLFVDEAAEIAPQRRARGAAESSEWAERIAKRGRKVGLFWWMASQRPSDLSKSVYAQANVKLVGRVEIINDYDAVRGYFSRRVTLDELARLEAGEFLLDISGVTVTVRINQRRSQDLGRTPLA